MSVPATPGVVEVRRDAVHREIRLELAEWRTRTGGVYDLSPEEQETLMLVGHLPGWGDFLPDFVIVYATGEPHTLDTEHGPVETVAWVDLKVHVGGVQRDAVADPALRRGINNLSASAEWNSVRALVLGEHRPDGPAPAWLLDLIRRETPWGSLVDDSPEPDPFVYTDEGGDRVPGSTQPVHVDDAATRLARSALLDVSDPTHPHWYTRHDDFAAVYEWAKQAVRPLRMTAGPHAGEIGSMRAYPSLAEAREFLSRLRAER